MRKQKIMVDYNFDIQISIKAVQNVYNNQM